MNYKNDYEIIYMIRENDDIARNIMFDKYMPIVKNIASNLKARLYSTRCQQCCLDSWKNQPAVRIF